MKTRVLRVMIFLSICLSAVAAMAPTSAGLALASGASGTTPAETAQLPAAELGLRASGSWTQVQAIVAGEYPYGTGRKGEVDIAVDSAGNWHAVYTRYPTISGGSAIMYATRGAEPIVLASAHGPAYTVGMPSVAIDRDGNPHVAYCVYYEETYTFDVWYDHKVSGSWAATQVIVSGESPYGTGRKGEVDLAIDPAGNWHAVYTRYPTMSSGCSIMYATSGSEPIALSWADGTHYTVSMPSVAVDQAGKPHVAWCVYNEETYTFDVWYTHKVSGAWAATQAIVSGVDPYGTGRKGEVDLAIDPAGNWHVVFTLYPTLSSGSSIMYATKGSVPVALSWADGTHYTASMPSVAIDHDGNPHVAYCVYNEETYAFDVYYTYFNDNREPVRPSNVSPADGTTGVSLAPTLRSSDYSDPDSADRHSASQWMVTTTAGNYRSPAFANSSDAANLTSITTSMLDYSTTYYWMVRYEDNHGAWSYWSAETSFTTMAAPTVDKPPSQPGNVSPADGAPDVSLTPVLQTSAFSDLDAGDTHAASQWQITTTAGNYDSPVLDSGTDIVHLTSIAAPKLSNSTTYYWRVRHQDSRDGWSGWSTETSFKTLPITSAVQEIPVGGGRVETGDSRIALDSPAGATATAVTIVIKQVLPSSVAGNPQGFSVGSTCFTVEAVGADGIAVGSLLQPVTITAKYTDEDVAAAGGDPNDLVLACYDEADAEWNPFDTTVNTSDMTLSTTTTQLSTWAVLTKAAEDGGNGESGGCCSPSSAHSSAADVAVAWGSLGLCSGTAYLLVKKAGRHKGKK